MGHSMISYYFEGYKGTDIQLYPWYYFRLLQIK